MRRTVKIFVDERERASLPQDLEIVASYDGFVIAEASATQAKRLARDYLVEDITDQYTIELAGDEVDTSTPRIDSTGAVQAHPAYRRAPSLPAGPHHYLIQFIGPIKQEWLDAVRKAGGEPRDLYSNFVYVVRADDASIAKVAALPSVRWVGHLPYRARLAEPVRKSVSGEEPSTLPRTQVLDNAYTVEFFGSDDAARAVSEVRSLGLDVLAQESDARILVVKAADRAAERRRQLTALAAIHGVRTVRQRALARPSNDVAIGIMAAKTAMGSPGLGLTGKDEVIAVCDTGLDTGVPTTIHPDFAGRVASVTSYPITSFWTPYINNAGANDGPADLNSGHGTHVSGSVLGDGTSSNGLAGLTGPIRGCAFKARLVFQAVEQALDWKDPAHLQKLGRYKLAGIPVDIAQLFAEAYAKGARIHSNSWGGGDPGAYDDQCQAVDQFTWDHKDFCIVYSAGNDGTDKDGNGVINRQSVTAPGTAKNCITVGACENRRPNFNAETYGEWWPDDYPVAPFNAAPMADDPQQVVAFSSRGPTADGRFKPDVVAPGTFILSTRSSMIALNNKAWAAFPPSRRYFHMGGTSMATPLVAGAAALIREYLRKRKRIAAPTGALLKAALIASTVRLPSSAPAGTVADNDQGYGRANIDAVLAPKAPASARFLEVAPGVRTGERHRQRLTIKSNAQPLRIVLAYTDSPGPSLVNNLNLIVTGPDGRKVAGNQRAGAGASLDATNNTELVHVAKPAPGAWTVDVVGSNVPVGPQDFALVALGHF